MLPAVLYILREHTPFPAFLFLYPAIPVLSAQNLDGKGVCCLRPLKKCKTSWWAVYKTSDAKRLNPWVEPVCVVFVLNNSSNKKV